MRDAHQQAHDRILRVFRFLHELSQIRYPIRRQIHEQPWVLWFRDLPEHPAIQCMMKSHGTSDADEADYILKVRRPDLTSPPEPPDLIEEWLERGWNDPFGEPQVRASIDVADADKGLRVVPFDGDSRRVQAYEEWRQRWSEWATNERPAREAMRVFERLYELRGRIGREGERLELMVGEGILSWRMPSGGIYHPVLLQRVQLEFDPDVPEFTIVETDQQVELYSALLRLSSEVEPQAIISIRDEAERGLYSPLGGDDTSGFLRRLVQQLSSKGQFIERGAPKGETAYPSLGRDPVLFLRERTLGFAAAIEGILEDLPNRADLLKPLLNVVGIEQVSEGVQDVVLPLLTGDESEDILFSKQWNQEQIRIAERLTQHGAVIVQGPPGTGKTHTIANLIGHLLAQGKTVLVTAHTTKALRVLRDQVVQPLQPLCVSVLESDLESRRQLGSSVEAIVERLSKSDASQLEAEASRLASQRNQLLVKLHELREMLLEALASEYRDIIVAGQSYAPSEAARKVAKEKGQNDWIPEPIEPGISLPLSKSDLFDLYQTNVTVTVEDEAELSHPLPAPSGLMTPDEFRGLVTERESLVKMDLNYRQELWQTEPGLQDAETLEKLLEKLLDATQLVSNSEEWKLAIIEAGKKGQSYEETWRNLITLIRQVEGQSAKVQEALIRHDPRPSAQINLEDQKRIAEAICQYLTGQNKLTWWRLLWKPSWKRFIQEVQVSSGVPQSVEHFRSLVEAINLEIARRELISRWDRQMTPLGAPPSTELGKNPEQVASQFIPIIERCLQWYPQVFKPLITELKSLDFRWDAFVDEQPPGFKPYGELMRLVGAVSESLPEILKARSKAICWLRIESKIGELRRKLSEGESGEQFSEVVRRLREAVRRLDCEEYGQAFQRLVDLHNRYEDVQRRRNLLTKLEPVAPSWATAIRCRQGIHGVQGLPGDPDAAWLWRQLHDELERRTSVSVQDIQDEIARKMGALRSVTTQLIERRAWAAQLRRTTLRQRQALIGWANIVRRMGRGYSRRDAQLRMEAAKNMSECRTAVPVWIMPLSRMVEYFDPRTTRFDVVIIDEASQSDSMALVAFYLARNVLVVGDHEQVSPEAVGIEIDRIEPLISEYLQGIPNAVLYDGRRSVYDIARESFGGTIVLLEHFRCVPDIIQFSNSLSYDGKIKPLRDSSKVTLKPHTIPYRVAGSRSTGKVNQEEALTIASLLIAATEMPEYEGKTFGVVSLLGEEQAIEVDRLLRRHIKPEEYERRRVLCGTAAQFQGDERDVVFLSLVDSPGEGPLPLRQDERFKQRFNVAASRARDQMWVVYSLDPQTDLKPGDLRRRLIEYALNPTAVMRMLESEESRAESEFEKEVLRRLVHAGYQVRSQWQVGFYRIDLVVEGNGQKLAIECDGDRYHPIEKLPEDIARQAVLERLGWRFVRIRGSQFFRDPDGTMKFVFERLEQLGILPEGRSEHTMQNDCNVDSLKDRVIRRAEEVRRSWAQEERETQGNIEDESSSTRRQEKQMVTQPLLISLWEQ